MKKQTHTIFLNDNSVLFAWFSNCTCDSFLRILLTSGEREQWNGERIREGGEEDKAEGRDGNKGRNMGVTEQERRGDKDINNSSGGR